MDRTTVERQKLIEVVSNLSDEALLELAAFLDKLLDNGQKDVVGLAPIRTVIHSEEEITAAHKIEVQKREPNDNPANFLIAVAGLGNSGQQDVSERDEEILSNEINPVYGWSLKSSNLNDSDT